MALLTIVMVGARLEGGWGKSSKAEPTALCPPGPCDGRREVQVDDSAEVVQGSGHRRADPTEEVERLIRSTDLISLSATRTALCVPAVKVRIYHIG